MRRALLVLMLAGPLAAASACADDDTNQRPDPGDAGRSGQTGDGTDASTPSSSGGARATPPNTVLYRLRSGTYDYSSFVDFDQRQPPCTTTQTESGHHGPGPDRFRRLRLELWQHRDLGYYWDLTRVDEWGTSPGPGSGGETQTAASLDAAVCASGLRGGVPVPS